MLFTQGTDYWQCAPVTRISFQLTMQVCSMDSGSDLYCIYRYAGMVKCMYSPRDLYCALLCSSLSVSYITLIFGVCVCDL